MSERIPADWDPRSQAVLDDQITAYDDMRRRCPIAYSEYQQWTVFRHADVLRILQDHESFSNVVSRHISVPNGMDPPLHTPYRKLIEPYFAADRVHAFEPECRAIAQELVGGLPDAGVVELNAEFAEPCALRIQCAFMGWPETLHEPLRQWMGKNRAATLSGNRAETAEVAAEFDGYIRALLKTRRSSTNRDDVTARLMREEVNGRRLSDEEIVSILRNWTVGELGTIAASVGILVHALAVDPMLQSRLRKNAALLPAAIDEILRKHAPLIANRRITTRPVEIGGRRIGAGERITILWASANRDEAVFPEPDAVRLDRDPRQNLLYGAGIHVCPGAPLARMELRVIMEALLAGTSVLATVPAQAPQRACYPGSGFTVLPLRVESTCKQ